MRGLKKRFRHHIKIRHSVWPRELVFE